MKKMLIALCVFGLTIILGCSSFQDAVTPCYISEESIEYADTEPTIFLPFTTLFDARRIGAKMDFIYYRDQLVDKMQYEYLKGVNSFHIGVAEEFQERIFAPEGSIGLLLTTLMGGTLGTVLLSKPEDKKKIKDLEGKVNGN